MKGKGCRGVCSPSARRSAWSGRGGRTGRGEGYSCSAVPYPSKTEGQDRARGEQEEDSQVCTPVSSVHTSIPPAQVFFPQQAVPGHSRSPPSPQGGSPAARPTWKLTGDIKAATDPSLHSGGKFPRGCSQAATSQGIAVGWSQHLPRQCHGQSLHQQLPV